MAGTGNVWDSIISPGASAAPTATVAPRAAPASHGVWDSIIGNAGSSARSADGGGVGSPVPTDTPKHRGTLDRIGDTFGIAGSTIGATLRDIQQEGLLPNLNPFHEGPNMRAYNKQAGPLGGKGDMAGANEEYYVTGNRNLDAMQKKGGALGTVAHQALEHPYLTGAATLAGEMFNPMNVMTGEAAGTVGRAVGKGVGIARAASPAFDRAAGAVERPVNAAVDATVGKVGDAVGSLFNRFHGVEKMSPGLGETFGRRSDVRTATHPNQVATELQNTIFGSPTASGIGEKLAAGTTDAQKFEILRRAEQDTATGKPLNIPRPVADPKIGPTLDERASQLTDYLRDVSQRLVSAGKLPEMPKRILSPRDDIGGKTIWGDPEVAKIAPTVTTSGAPRSLDELERATGIMGRDLFAPHVDPARAVYQFARGSEGKLGEINTLKRAESLPTETGQAARIGEEFHLPPSDSGFPGATIGLGPAAANTAKNFARRTASQEAARAASGQLGLLGRAVNPQLVRGQLLQAGRGANAAERTAKGVESAQDAIVRGGVGLSDTLGRFGGVGAKGSAAAGNLTSAVDANATGANLRGIIGPTRGVQNAADVGGREIDRATAAGNKQIDKMVDAGQGGADTARTAADAAKAEKDALEAKYTAAKGNWKARQVIVKQVQSLISRRAAEIMDTMTSPIPEGYVRESGAGLGLGGASKNMLVHEDLADFMKHATTSGALPEDAQGVGKFLAGVNALARGGLLLVPTVHAVWNLGMGFLSMGGTPLELGAALANRVKIDPAVMGRLEREGGAPAYHPGTVDELTRNQTIPLQEIDPRAKGISLGERAARVGQVAGKTANVMFAGAERHYVFDTVERNYSYLLFDRLTKNGMSDADAARAIRKAFGDSASMTHSKVEDAARNVFFFYPWMKTVVPYWTQKSAQNFGWVNAPRQAIHVTNENQGDVPDESDRYARNPFSLTVGKDANGNFRRVTLPMPQRVVGALADAVGGNGSGQSPIYDRTEGITNYLRGHLNPIASTLADAFVPGQSKYQRINVDPLAPTSEKLKQGAYDFLQRFAPPLENIPKAAEDPVGTLGTFLGGGFLNSVPSADERADQRSIRQSYSEGIHDALADGDQKEAARLYYAMLDELKQPSTP